LNILITGGSGSFGTAFVKHLLHVGGHKRIVVFSRGELRQFQMSQELLELDRKGVLRFMIGDVRDEKRLCRAMENIDVVVHAAALKRIEVGHYNPQEMVKTNVGGALNVIEAAKDAGVKKVVGLSSDKAFEPVSPYGTSKAMAESLFLAANNTMGQDGPRFAVTRYGNVWRSNGSVVPVWEAMIKKGAKSVPITDPDCTRFFMPMKEAIQLVLTTIETMKGGEVNVPTLPAYRLGDLAEAMGVQTHVIGLPAWEKAHESMSAGNSSDKTQRMTVGDLRKVLRDE